MITQKYIIKGMTCAACSSAVERVTRKMDGVLESNVNLTTGLMMITYDETKVTPELIIRKVDRAGFGAELCVDEKQEVAPEDDVRKMKYRLICNIILAIPLLIVYLLTIIFLGAPALYKQARPGKNHKVFYIYKFRSTY